MPSPDDSGLSADTYEMIEAALAQTAQGRRFLLEIGRRSRGRDHQATLEAIARLEQQVSGRLMSDEVGRLRDELADMSETIRRTRREIAELAQGSDRVGRLDDASEALDAIVRTTETATSTILDSAERIQEAAWTMREGGFDPTLCDALDARATDIYAACAFQDVTAQQIGHVVRSLTFLEQRLRGLCATWGLPEPAPAGPPLDQSRLYLSQSDIDFVIVDEADCEGEAQPNGATGTDPGPTEAAAPAAKPPERHEAALARIAEIEAMGVRERLALFS